MKTVDLVKKIVTANTMKTFIDCGFHHGEGLKSFVQALGIGAGWKVHCFEANPECRMSDRIRREYKGCDFNIYMYHKAVWIRYGKISFSQENHYRSGSGSPTDGTSIRDGWRSRISENEICTTQAGFESPIYVTGIDFSKWLANFQGRDEVYCKMDIEGSEFAVLRKILQDGNAGIFKKLWVEFHPDDVPGETLATKRALIAELSKFTSVEEWN